MSVINSDVKWFREWLTKYNCVFIYFNREDNFYGSCLSSFVVYLYLGERGNICITMLFDL